MHKLDGPASKKERKKERNLKTMADKYTSQIDQQPKFLVGDFERDEGVFRQGRIQIPSCLSNARGVMFRRPGGSNGSARMEGGKDSRWMPEKSVR